MKWIHFYFPKVKYFQLPTCPLYLFILGPLCEKFFLFFSLVPGATIVAPTDHLHDHGYFCPTDKTSDQEGDLLILADDDDLSTKSNCK